MGRNIRILTSILTVISLQILLIHVGVADEGHTGKMIQTEVIADRGGLPIDKYMPGSKKISNARWKIKYRDRLGTKFVDTHFPVRTSLMTIGRVTKSEAKDIKYQVATRPMFIVGYDPVSINWLKSNQALLTKKGAIGLVVNVENKEQMDILQKIVGSGVMMQPTPGDKLSRHLKIKHYPFYMDNQGIMR